MLGLNLREEFRGRRLKGTAIELTNSNKTGAADIPAADFLEITYPSIDLLKSIEAIGPGSGRTVVLKGERGQGKSHLMATLFHAMNDPTATIKWLDHWKSTVPEADSSKLKLRSGMHVITAMLHKQRFKHLWDLLFDQHPHGEVGKALWENEGANKSNVPSDEIMLKMFNHTPCCLILDEFQTWFDGLRSSKTNPEQVWAFNFIQTLSEIADEHPDLLVLVTSIRNGNTDAFHQLRRVNPIVVDFTSTGAKYDRQRLLLHRLFENRRHVEPAKIESVIQTHISEYLRLSDAPSSEHEQIRRSFIEAWPYAPHLMSLLEDQVLIATQAQETRDLIRILADLFKEVGGAPPILTAAHFRLDDDKSSVAALLDSVANTHHNELRKKALRNIENVRNATASTGHKLPHLEAIVSSLWLRSLADVNQAGADRETLHIDVTCDKIVDDTPFEVELNTIVENSWNIHDDGGRYIFKQEENPQAKLIASARNDKLFTDGDDLERLSLETRMVIVGDSDASARFQVVVMPQHWRNDPWEKVAESDQPQRWTERIPVLVLPECPPKIEPTLGTWLRDNLQKNRNAVRFLIPRGGSKNLFADRDLVVLARCVLLAEKWKSDNAQYSKLMINYQKELRGILKARFDRFAIISNWNFQKPENCHFFIESHKAEGAKMLGAIDTHIFSNLFIPEEFADFFQTAAEQNQSVGKLIGELREPRPSGDDCIPWLGEVLVKEQITRLCARDKIAVNVRGNFYMQRKDGEDEEQAYKRLRGQLPSGSHLDECHVLLPQNVPTSGGGPKPDPGLNGGDGQTATGTGPTSTTNTLGGTQTTGGATTGGQSTGGQTGGGTAKPGDLFGGSSSYSSIAIPTTSALNLLGKIESSGIAAGSQLRGFKLQVDSMTGAQLQELIKKLPDGMKYQLDVEKEQAS